MNRLVIIGNGFDLAHGLKTSYKDFINWYWEQRLEALLTENTKTSSDCLCTFYILNTINNYSSWRDFVSGNTELRNIEGNWIYPAKDIIKEIVRNVSLIRITKSSFFENITNSIESKGWVDIENEYYQLLKKNYNQIDKCKDLNRQLKFLQDKLVEYLSTLDNVKKNDAIYNILNEKFYLDDFCVSVKSIEDDHPSNIAILNFNYTNTVKKYDNGRNTLIYNIHGSLDKPEGIIFGYGDELDKNYQDIRDMNENELLRYMKNVKYLEANNYKIMLQFIETVPFQVYIMGHSCGNSDRTLLNTIFEHKNCVSIKPFYYQKPDGTDNYLDIVQNISRNFTDMKLFRDKVVNKTRCISLPQSQEQ